MIKRGDLQDRVIGGGAEDPDRLSGENPERPRGRPAKAEEPGPSLQDRLVAARLLTAPPGACRACFQAGRDAAVGLLSRASDSRPLADRLVEAAALRPTHDHGGDPAFRHGRDAAIRLIIGENVA